MINKAAIIFLFCLLLCKVPSAAGTWKTLGNAGFAGKSVKNVSLFISSGVPYIAYSEYGTTTVMKYNGAAWETVGQPGLSDAGDPCCLPLSLYIDNGTPYVAYRDKANGDKATVMKYDGVTWEAVGQPGFSYDSAHSLSLCVEKNVPYLAYTAQIGKAGVMKFNGAAWEEVGSLAGKCFDHIFLRMNKGTPYLFYMKYCEEKSPIKYLISKFNGKDWETISEKNYGAALLSRVPSFFVDNGIPYFLFTVQKLDETSTKKDYFTCIEPKADVMKLNGAAWEALGNAGFSSGDVSCGSLYVNDGVPYVAYSDENKEGKMTLKKCHEGNWAGVGQAGFTAGKIERPSLYFCKGVPYVAYVDKENGDGVTVMKYDGRAAEETFAMDINELSLDAMADMANGAYESAIGKFDQVIDMNPHRAELFMLRGQCYEKTRNFARSIADYRRALRMEPNWAEAYYELGGSYYFNGNYDRAVECETKALELAPSLAGAYTFRAYANYKLKRHDKARSDVNKAQKLGSTIEPDFLELLASKPVQAGSPSSNYRGK